MADVQSNITTSTELDTAVLLFTKIEKVIGVELNAVEALNWPVVASSVAPAGNPEFTEN